MSDKKMHKIRIRKIVKGHEKAPLELLESHGIPEGLEDLKESLI